LLSRYLTLISTIYWLGEGEDSLTITFHGNSLLLLLFMVTRSPLFLS